MDTGEAASVAAPGALGVLNPCARDPRHLHAGYSTALAYLAEMGGWWAGQAVGVAAVVVMVVEAVAALGEVQSVQNCSLSCASLQG